MVPGAPTAEPPPSAAPSTLVPGAPTAEPPPSAAPQVGASHNGGKSSRRRQRKGPEAPPSAPWIFFCTLWLCAHLEPLLSPELRQLLLLTLTERPAPQDAGKRWTLRALQRWMREQCGVDYSTETLRRVLRRLGYSWKKARKLLARANTLARLLFLRQLLPLLEQAQQGDLVLAYCDEAHIHCDCDLGYAWGRRGEPLFIYSTSPGLSYKSSFYGFYLFPLARVHIWPAPYADSDQTLLMLERLRQTYPQHRLVLLWDGASYHRTQAVRDRAAALGIALLPLPGYSPDFMPVEALWRWLRQEVTGNFCHASVAQLIDHVARFVADIHRDPAALAVRLALKTSLNPREEEIRISNGF